MILAAIQFCRILNFLQSNCDKMTVYLLCCANNVFSTLLYPLLSIPHRFILAPHFVLSLIDSLFEPHDLLLSALKLCPCNWLLLHHLCNLICVLFDLIIFLTLGSDLLSEFSNFCFFLILLLPFEIDLK